MRNALIITSICILFLLSLGIIRSRDSQIATDENQNKSSISAIIEDPLFPSKDSVNNNGVVSPIAVVKADTSSLGDEMLTPVNSEEIDESLNKIEAEVEETRKRIENQFAETEKINPENVFPKTSRARLNDKYNNIFPNKSFTTEAPKQNKQETTQTYDGEKPKLSISFAPGNVYFTPEEENRIKRLGAHLNQHKYINILITGHSDTKESNSSKLPNLSLARAEKVKSELEKLGIEENRIIVEGHDSKHPRKDNKSFDGRNTNRRAEVFFFVR